MTSNSSLLRIQNMINLRKKKETKILQNKKLKYFYIQHLKKNNVIKCRKRPSVIKSTEYNKKN